MHFVRFCLCFVIYLFCITSPPYLCFHIAAGEFVLCFAFFPVQLEYIECYNRKQIFEFVMKHCCLFFALSQLICESTITCIHPFAKYLGLDSKLPEFDIATSMLTCSDDSMEIKIKMNIWHLGNSVIPLAVLQVIRCPLCVTFLLIKGFCFPVSRHFPNSVTPWFFIRGHLGSPKTESVKKQQKRQNPLNTESV